MYKVGDIVRVRPNWPTKPSYGIWMKDNPPEGKVALITGLRGNYSDGQTYGIQFETNHVNGRFYDCHWPIRESEILGYAR